MNNAWRASGWLEKWPWSFGWNLLSKSLFWPPPSLLSTLWLPTPLFLPAPPIPTTPFLGSVDLLFKVFSIEVSGIAIRLNLDEPPVEICKANKNLLRVHFLFDNTSTTFMSSTTTSTNNLIVINTKSWCNEWSSCFQYCGEWYYYLSEALDKTSVEICKTDKDLLWAHCYIGWPFSIWLYYQAYYLLVTTLLCVNW